MTITAADNHPDEHDPDRDRICERNGCLELATMTDDYCAAHQQEVDDERARLAEPDDPDAAWDDRDLL